MGIKEEIVKSGLSMRQIVSMLNEKYNRHDTVQNLSAKLIRGTLKYNEAIEIADIIGKQIIWIDKKNEG